MDLPPFIQLTLCILLAGGVAYLVFFHKRNLWLQRKNLILGRKLKRSNRKVDAWQRGWDLEKQRFLEALSDAFLLVNFQGQVLAANRKAKMLFENPALEGVLLSEYVRNESLAKEIRKALGGGDEYVSEFFLSATSSPFNDQGEGETKWLIDVAPVIGVDGCRRILLRDITEQHRTEQVRKDFVANASHELRTPMTIIIGYLESMLEDDFIKDSPDAAGKFMKIMYKHGLRLQRIVEDMLMISKLEASEGGTLKEEIFDLRECVTDVYARLESIFESRKATLRLNFQPSEIKLYGDKFYWTQIFFNLIENALKQNAGEGLVVEVGALSEPGTAVRLWIADNGIGIPEAHLPYIFKRFYRVESKQAGEIKGTGLGLSIVKRAVEAHDGVISVASRPGVETRFAITLPPERAEV